MEFKSIEQPCFATIVPRAPGLLAATIRQQLRQRSPLGRFRRNLGPHLHIVDALETAHAFGLSVRPRAGRDPALSVDVNFDPCRQHDLDTLIRAWLPLTYAVNSLNHSVGQPDLYPFVLAPQVMGKLRFVHSPVHPTALGAGPLRTPAG